MKEPPLQYTEGHENQFESSSADPIACIQRRDSRSRFGTFATVLGLCASIGFASLAAAQGVLKTGQTKCWNSAGTQITCTGTGQDGEVQIGVARSYTDNGDGTITDNATGLVWEKLDNFNFVANPSDIHDADNTYNPWTAAFQKIATLNAANFAGHNDWRLPNIKELHSLIWFGRSAPAVDTAFNNGTDSFTRSTGTYWSSTTSNTSITSQAWGVSFTTGIHSLIPKTSAANSFCCFVRAVRGPITLSPSPKAPVLKTGQTQCWNSTGTLISCTGTGQDGELQIGVAQGSTDNGNGTITDNATALTWEKLGNLDGTANLSDPHDADNNYTTWDLAFQKIADLNTANFAGHNDWRMPNILELESLADFGNFGPAIDSAFDNGTDSLTRPNGYWSSTTSLSLSIFANAVNFLQGNAYFQSKTNPFANGAVRAVRGSTGLDLTVAKTATPGFTRTYTWTVGKTASQTLFKQIGGTVAPGYSIAATEASFADNAFQVTGTITVSNPNAFAVSGVTVTDVDPAATSCAVTNGTNVSVAAAGSVPLSYACTYSSNPGSGTDTATAAWVAATFGTPDGSASSVPVSYTFGSPTLVDQTINVYDCFNGCLVNNVKTPKLLGSVTATNALPYASQTFPDSYTVSVPANGCVSYSNTATIVDNVTSTQLGSADASVAVCGPAKTGALSMGFWQNKNGQGIIAGGTSTGGVCNSGTWLRGYAPFQDLSKTATCSQVAAYVSNIIKAANASGVSMNAMLKAQDLATSLDTYFSDPLLGGNKISAPAPIGGVSIDLTKICKMIDGNNATCSGAYENVSSAFGGATSLTVLQIEAYAASQSNSGGSFWYGNVKTTQGLAKDTFDAINNQVAFGP